MQDMPPDMLKQLELGYRFGVTKQWAQAAHAVTTETKIPSSTDVWDFISMHTTLGVAAKDSGIEYFFTLEPTKPVDEYAFLTPIIDSDIARLGPEDARLMFARPESTKFAEFHPGTRAIYLSERELSDHGRGILLLSVAQLARAHILVHAPATERLASTYAEAESYVFAFQLLQALGGEPYVQLISNLQILFSGDGDAIVFPAVNSSSASPVWEQMFGPAATNSERMLWDGAACLHAYWRYIQDRTTQPLDLLSKHLQKTPAE